MAALRRVATSLLGLQVRQQQRRTCRTGRTREEEEARSCDETCNEQAGSFEKEQSRLSRQQARLTGVSFVGQLQASCKQLRDHVEGDDAIDSVDLL
eukprot:scaffold878_cov271-Pinguiococcus_pyrenoidosus.AAC.17